MSLNPTEQAVQSYYLATAAKDLDIAGRWYPHGDLILVIEDKIAVATRKFGFKVKSKAKPVAAALLDTLIAKGAFETKVNDYGGSMHQFQGDAYRAALKDLQAGDALVVEAAGQDSEFWAGKFETLTAA